MFLLSFLFSREIFFIGDSHTAGPFGSTLVKSWVGEGHRVFRGNFGSSRSKHFLAGNLKGRDPVAVDLEGKKIPIKVISRGTRRSSGYQPVFVQVPSFSKLNAYFKPIEPVDFVIALGSNGGTENEDLELLNLIRDQMLENDRCFFIGPPDMRGKSSFLKKKSAMIQNAILNSGRFCTFLDSRKWTKYPSSGGDGVHYLAKWKSLIQKWVDGVVSAMNES